MSDLAVSERKAISILDVYANPEIALQQDQINQILNTPPPASWVKVHPYIAGYKYLPIDKVEFLLRKIFKRWKVEIIREGVAFNGVYVVVRVWYVDLASPTGEMIWQDGIGASQLQTKKGTSPADLANINNGALSMAFPLAETVAIKDATDKIGQIFGSDLNRKDIIPFSPDEKLADSVLTKAEERLKQLIEAAKTEEELDDLFPELAGKAEILTTQYNEKWKSLTNK